MYLPVDLETVYNVTDKCFNREKLKYLGSDPYRHGDSRMIPCQHLYPVSISLLSFLFYFYLPHPLTSTFPISYSSSPIQDRELLLDYLLNRKENDSFLYVKSIRIRWEVTQRTHRNLVYGLIVLKK